MVTSVVRVEFLNLDYRCNGKGKGLTYNITRIKAQGLARTKPSRKGMFKY